ncbi:hypothetical protein AY601_4399 [Pedobacter cryoconitis]|uniref:Oligosaccharide repeat unit polymerase n=1 Tax=Pedobacter cryoconitis TaxID=188932 RepID=A0A127VIZ6_9SPHI|nr:hypothetical protein [Pedobacter cryoconitis]AMQ01242.1 hypothetical protein AY601_4399 [Pedobacter cryoconitis]
MNNRIFIEKYIVLFIPWILAMLFQDSYMLSYFIAWFGSFFIFWITLKGRIIALPDDRNIEDQLMRPIFLTQVIFAGYMACTSIFYFFDVLGYINFHKLSNFYLVDQDRLRLVAQCQRYYCLAHASFVTGILAFMRYPVEKKYGYNRADLTKVILNIALITTLLSFLLMHISGLSQFSHQFSLLSFIAGTLALAFAIPNKNIWRILICLIIYGFNLYEALISGFKEPIILNVLILGIFLYPNYKRTVLLFFVPLLLLFFILLPTYNRIFRQQAWSGNLSTTEATQLALKSVVNQNNADDNWAFFTYRLSEIDMFTNYVKSTPAHIDFYGTQLLRQSAIAIMPRILWPSKPITENMVMERVYNAGIISRGSNASAKPAIVVDAYLSGGIVSIFILLFIYGAACQLIAIKAEKIFGGYTLGTALIFTGLFQLFWRGLSLEFLINAVFWNYVTMYLIFRVLLFTNVIKRL